MIGSVTKSGALNLFAPTTRPRRPDEIMQDVFNKRQQERIEKVYENLCTKVKNGEQLSDAEKLQFVFLKALDIAQDISQPVIKYNA